MAHKKKNLLFDDEEEDQPAIKVNKEYADRFTHNKEREELERLKEKFESKQKRPGFHYDSESSDSEEEDETGILDKPEWDEQFFRIIPKIITKDPEIYNKKDFFEDVQDDTPKPKQKKEKPLYLKDMLRKSLLEGKVGDESEEEEEEQDEKDLSVVEQQKKAKKDFLNAAKHMLENEDDGSDDDLFSIRQKSKEELDREDADLKEFEAKLKAKAPKDELDVLKRYWAAKELDDSERFLRDYIINKRWMEKSENPTYEDIVEEEQDNFDEAELYEGAEAVNKELNFLDYVSNTKYRFQEQGATEVKTYPRQIEDSLRRDRKSEKRKEQRKEHEEKKEEKKKQKEEELKRLKNLKKKEIERKIKEIQQITGVEEFKLGDEDLEEDFDPEKWDSKMSSMFNDDYYSKEDMEAPHFEYDEEIDGVKEYELNQDMDDEVGATFENIDFDAPEVFHNPVLDKARVQSITSRKEFQKAKKDAINKTKEQLESSLEEYYKLDYEDLINGEIPCRFKYATVPKTTYGLSLKDILTKDDKDLNKVAPFKRIKAVYAQQGKKKKRRVDDGNHYNDHNNNNYNNNNSNNGAKRVKTHNNDNSNNNMNRKKNNNNNNNFEQKHFDNKKETKEELPEGDSEEARLQRKKQLLKERKKRMKMKKKMFQPNEEKEEGETEE